MSDPARQVIHNFRCDPCRPYFKIQVGDLIRQEETDRKMEAADLEVWGLSGWFLNCLACTVGWFMQPEFEDPGDQAQKETANETAW